MRWRKSVPGCFLWLISMLGAGIVYWQIVRRKVSDCGLNDMAGIGISISCLLLPVLVFVILSLAGKQFRKIAGKKADKEKRLTAGKVVVPLAAVLLLAFGIYLRMDNLAYAGEAAAYYDTAMVTQSGALPKVVHGAVFLYLTVLRNLFLTVGNRWMAGIWLQIVLQLAGSLFLYLGIRKLAGEFPALAVFAYLMLSPDQVLAGIMYSPQMLFLLIFGLALLAEASLFTGIVKNQKYGVPEWLLMLLSAAVPALACYMDISGFALIVPLLSVVWLSTLDERHAGRKKCRVIAFLAAWLAFLLLYFALDAYSSGETLPEVLNAYRDIYLVQAYDPWFWQSLQKENVLLVLAGLSLTGGLAYWKKGHSDTGSFWNLSSVFLGVLLYLHMMTTEADNSALLVCMVIVMTASGISYAFSSEGTRSTERAERVKNAEKAELAGKAKNAGKAERVERVKNAGKTERVERVKNAGKAERTGKADRIRTPEHPKKEHKVPGYAVNPTEDKMDYDIEVGEDDDFDL